MLRPNALKVKVVCPDFQPAGFPDGFQAILPTPPPKPASLKSYTFYRGDARSPDKMKEGFQAWVPLSADQARALLRRIAATYQEVSAGHAERWLQCHRPA
jgi:hypothetical protein